MALIISQTLVWLILFRQLRGRAPLEFIKPRGSFFRYSAVVDFTAIMHCAGTFLLCIAYPVFGFGLMLVLELRDGFTSDEGFNLIDLAGNAFGVWLWWERVGFHVFELL